MNVSKDLPKVSFVIPVLNAGKILPGCMESIIMQDYPKNKLEVILADGFSKDNTLEVIDSYRGILDIKVLENKLVTAESGKAVGINAAKGEFICLIDSDNRLVGEDWLKKMIVPLQNDPTLLGSEPLYFQYNKEDGYIDRYCSLIGMNDPICIWLGAYDRYNLLTKKWNGLNIEEEDKKDHIKLKLESHKIPTIGANGTVFRKNIFVKYPNLSKNYLFDMEILEHIVNKEGSQYFAKVKVGIVHLYCGSNLKNFKKKQLRRVRDFLFRRSIFKVIAIEETERSYTYGQNESKKLLLAVGKFMLYCVLIFPLFIQSLIGYSRKKDIAWFAHPILCWITLIVYIYGTIESLVSPKESDRSNWNINYGKKK